MKANITHIRTATVQYQGEFRASKAKEAATPFVESAEELIEAAASRGAWAVASFRVKDFPTEEAYHAYCDYFEAIGYSVFFCQNVIVICWEPSCRKPDEEHPVIDLGHVGKMLEMSLGLVAAARGINQKRVQVYGRTEFGTDAEYERYVEGLKNHGCKLETEEVHGISTLFVVLEDENKLPSCPDPRVDEIVLKIQHAMQPIVNEIFTNTLVRELEVNLGNGWCVTCKQR